MAPERSSSSALDQIEPTHFLINLFGNPLRSHGQPFIDTVAASHSFERLQENAIWLSHRRLLNPFADSIRIASVASVKSPYNFSLLVWHLSNAFGRQDLQRCSNQQLLGDSLSGRLDTIDQMHPEVAGYSPLTLYRC